MDKVTPKQMAAIEAVFAAEIERKGAGKKGLSARLPKRMKETLIERGLIVEETQWLGRDRFGAIEVPVLSLTFAGNYAYCQWAALQERIGVEHIPR